MGRDMVSNTSTEAVLAAIVRTTKLVPADKDAGDQFGISVCARTAS